MEENKTPEQPVAPQPTETLPSTPAVVQPTNGGMSHDAKVLIVVLCLLFAWPVGLILMWLWMKAWPLWLKLLISLPLLFAVLGIFAVVTLVALNPSHQFEKAREIRDWKERQYVTSPMPHVSTQSATPSGLPVKSVPPKPRT